MNAYTQALQNFKNFAGKTATNVGSFLQQNPTPAGFIQQQLSPVAQKFVQSVNKAWTSPQPSPQQYAQQNFQSLPQRITPAVAKFTSWAQSSLNNFSYKPAQLDVPNIIASQFGGGSEVYKTTEQQPVYPFRELTQTIRNPEPAFREAVKFGTETALPALMLTTPVGPGMKFSLEVKNMLTQLALGTGFSAAAEYGQTGKVTPEGVTQGAITSLPFMFMGGVQAKPGISGPKSIRYVGSKIIGDAIREIGSTTKNPEEMALAISRYVDEYKQTADAAQLKELRAGLVKELTNLTGGSGNYKKDYAMRVALRNDEQIGSLVRSLEDHVGNIDVQLLRPQPIAPLTVSNPQTVSAVDLDPSWIKESPTLTTRGGLGREIARRGYVANEIEGLTPQEGHRLLAGNVPAYKDDMMVKAELWHDKRLQLAYGRETMERNFGDIMGKDAPGMVNTYIEPVYTSNATRVKWLTQERKEIAALGIKPRSEDSRFVQMLGERKISPKEISLLPPARAEKIFTAEKVLREKYNAYLEKLNLVLKRNGYDPVPKREDYFRHFTEIKGLLEQVGIPLREHSLPTDINGLTADFRPGRQFFASTLQRKTEITDYDAIQGIDGYIEGASKQMFQTDNIKRLRQLDKSIRETFAGTRHLSKFVADLTEYTNLLAGKKAMFDRSVETSLGREVYAATDRLRKQTGANMVGFNVSSAMTNFIPLTHALATTDKPSLIRGMMQTIVSTFKDDGFVSRSDFLTSRHGSDKLSMNAWEKIGDKSFWLFKVIDNFVSGTVVRGKYGEGIKKGLTPIEAMKQANSWGRKMLGGRTAGEMPTLFGSKTLGLLTQFQLEVNNQVSFMFKDIPRNYSKPGAASALAQVFIYGYIFNNVWERVFGRRPAFDPIGVALQAYEDYTNQDMKEGQATKNLVRNVQDYTPFASALTGGRIPVGSAVPNPFDVASGESTWGKEGKKLFYLLPPTGGGQLKKTLEGTEAYKQGGSTTDAGLVRYPIPQTTENALRTFIGGQFNTQEARKYFREGLTPLGEKQTEKFMQSQDKVKTYQDIMNQRRIDNQINDAKDSMKTTGKNTMLVGNNVLIKQSNGDISVIDSGYHPTLQPLTGNSLVDQKILTTYRDDVRSKLSDISALEKAKAINSDLAAELTRTWLNHYNQTRQGLSSKYVKPVTLDALAVTEAKSAINAQITDAYKSFQEGKLTASQAQEKMNTLSDLLKTYSSGRASTGRKISFRSAKFLSAKLAKTPSARRLKLRMPKLTYPKALTMRRLKVRGLANVPKMRRLKLRSIASLQKQFLTLGKKNALQQALASGFRTV